MLALWLSLQSLWFERERERERERLIPRLRCSYRFTLLQIQHCHKGYLSNFLFQHLLGHLVSVVSLSLSLSLSPHSWVRSQLLLPFFSGVPKIDDKDVPDAAEKALPIRF